MEERLHDLQDKRYLTRSAFLAECARLGLNANELEAALRAQGYTAKQGPEWISEKKLRKINAKYDAQTAIARVGILPKTRPMVVIG